ncbi:barstar family protein [Streptomyces sp. XY431]|uniref:barstar family protein n=1 Tax=Streptomyces sp. XY431 TaxID=1415562 RepID=UPI000AB39969|nr:barstar family protein [Streptomyces sp. XY431]
MLIDVGAVLDDRDLHATLQRELGLPSFYGGNWNAFRDAVTGLVVLPAEIRCSRRAAPVSPPPVRRERRRNGRHSARRPPGTAPARTRPGPESGRAGRRGPPGPPWPGRQVRVKILGAVRAVGGLDPPAKSRRSMG